MNESDSAKQSIPEKLEIALKLLGYQFDPASEIHQYAASIDLIPPPNESYIKSRQDYAVKYIKLIFTNGTWRYPDGFPHDRPDLIKLLRLHKEPVHGDL